MDKEMPVKDKDKLVGYAMKCAGTTTGDELMELISLCDRFMKSKVIESEVKDG